MDRHTYGFLGLGLIGGSLARNIKKTDPEAKILACSRRRETCEEALAAGMVDEILDFPGDERFADCRYLFLCAPVAANISLMRELVPVLSRNSGTIVTDVGSVKGAIHKEAAALGISDRFIGGHPMTGSERSGFANSNDHLFENAYYIITPGEGVDDGRVQEFRDFVLTLKAIPLILDYREHDFITAAISHLPHVVASSLVNTVHTLDGQEEHMKMIAAGGFKDITRIASSSPEMWEQICVDNHENISKVMDEFLREMIAARDHMCSGDGGYIHKMFEESRAYRSSFSERSSGPDKRQYRIYCDVIDEAGAIATIATILAVNRISIRNIGIVHNREFEDGALLIEFYDEDSMKKGTETLRHHRYSVWETK